MATRLGSTTHISVLDADGWACAVTCTNGEGSGIVVPGTGIHVNNMMGEEDLTPLGFFTAPAGPAAAVDDGADGRAAATATRELVLGCAGSNRIRSAILQVIVGVVDRGLDAAGRGRGAARCTWRTASSTPSRASTRRRSRRGPRRSAPFRDRNLFFGGCQAVERDPATGALTGGRRPAPRRRGGAGLEAAVPFGEPRPVGPS